MAVGTMGEPEGVQGSFRDFLERVNHSKELSNNLKLVIKYIKDLYELVLSSEQIIYALEEEKLFFIKRVYISLLKKRGGLKTVRLAA